MPISIGIDQLLTNHLHLIAGKRVGLISNAASRLGDGRTTLVALQQQPTVTIAALFAPEHGAAATLGAGVTVASDTTHPLPVYSLYGATLKPTAPMLAGLDILLFDLQTVGVRFYTYLTTLLYILQAAAEHDLPVLVCDRPNPLNGNTLAGPLLDPAFISFVGCGALPIRHGLTIGELALLFTQVWGVSAEITVIECTGWQRSMWFDQTGLTWHAPSPNLPTAATVLPYVGLCLIEGTNLSEGRGTDKPFRQIGAPWLDSQQLANQFSGKMGLHCRPTKFSPTSSKFTGQACAGVEFTVVDRDAFRPIIFTLTLISHIAQQYPEHFQWHTAHFDRLIGNDHVRPQLISETPITQITAEWPAQYDHFAQQRQSVLLYA